jgi:hypothetical protein
MEIQRYKVLVKKMELIFVLIETKIAKFSDIEPPRDNDYASLSFYAFLKKE